MPYHVYIDRSADPTPQGIAKLAAAIAQRFGMPQAAVEKGLSSRLRVKTNVEEGVARQFAGELAKLGAIVSVVDAASGAPLMHAGGARTVFGAPSAAPAVTPAAAAKPPSTTAPRVAIPAGHSATLHAAPGVGGPAPASGLSRATPQPMPAQPAPPPTATRAPAPAPPPVAVAAAPAAPPAPAAGRPSFESGLAAAYTRSSGSDDISLGALGEFSGSDSSGPKFMLSALDGSEDEPPPPPVAAAKTLGSNPGAPAGPPPKPHDPFSATGGLPEEEAPLELAETTRPVKKGTIAGAAPPAPNEARPKRKTQPPPGPPESETDEPIDLDEVDDGPVHTSHRDRMPDTGGGGKGALLSAMAEAKGEGAPPPLPTRRTPLPTRAQPAPMIDGGPLAKYFYGKPPPLRVVVGVALALGLGYVPAALYAGSAEDSKLSSLRAELVQLQTGVSAEQFKQVDAWRAETLGRMSSARNRIETTTAILWVLVGGGLGWAWFKKLV